jgi:hypothetical protein
MSALRLSTVTLFAIAALSAASAQTASTPAAPSTAKPGRPGVFSPNVAPLPDWTFTTPGKPLTASQAPREFTPFPAPKLPQTPSGFIQLDEKQSAALKLLAQNSPPTSDSCYTLRSYQFTPTTPGSGAGRITAESTCQAARTIHQKAILLTVPATKK